MTDEKNLRPMSDEQPLVEGEDRTVGPGAENGIDPTPAGDEGVLDEADTVDHSAWMRPAVGDDRATSEIVGALAPEPSTVAGTGEIVDVAADPVQAPDHSHAALVGARAAQRREERAGATLVDHPEAEVSLAKRLLPWLIGALVLGLVAFAIVLAVTRKPKVVAVDPSASPSTPELVQQSDLMSVADATRMAPQGAWRVTGTVDKLTATTPKVACLGSTQGQPNTTVTRQRTLATTKGPALVQVHQVDGYASVTDARKAFGLRQQLLASCGSQPALIVRADQVSGLGDEATSLTVAFQERVTQYDTVVLVRTGNTIHSFDLAQANKPLPAGQVLKAAAGPVARQCARAGGNCASAPRAAAALPPIGGVPGWLITADLPRVSPGAGLWTSTDTASVATKGSGCENMTLSSVSGPSKREQRSYLMTQDNAAPTTFGLDEVLFTFPNDAAARSFASTLQGNIANCAKRSTTAKVGETGTVNRRLPGATVVGGTALVTQSMGGGSSARFRTAVVQSGKHVAYLVNNPSPSYDLGRAQFEAVAGRAGERASQAA